MNWKAWTPLAVAIVLGLLAAWLSLGLVDNAEHAQQPQAANFVPVVVAARDLEAGIMLTAGDLMMGRADQAMVPAGAFNSIEAATRRVAKVALVRGQPILDSVLAEEGAGSGVAATLPPGMRAISIEINDISGVAGFIAPKSYVDVVTTIQVDGKPVARTLLEGIRVLACGSRTDPHTPAVEPARTVTLLVKPEEAERLELAASTSRVRLLLRNGQDRSRSTTDGVTVADLKNGSQQRVEPLNDPFSVDVVSVPATQPSTPAMATANWTVEIIRAGQQSTQTFEIPVKPARPSSGSDLSDHAVMSQVETGH